MPGIDLDKTDRRILEVLQADGRLTNQEVADRVSLSASPCLRRIRRLEQLGVIRQYVALLEPQRIGLGLLAFVNLHLEKRMPHDDFKARVQAWPEVVACFAMTGEMDYLLRVHVEDLPHFSRFVMEQVLKMPGVIDVKSSFALEVVKDTTALPLRQLGV
ncbi:MAG TPA: Lrp/AsnC family transcriptional regulator [Burkholderiaceae bacterium]|jgi:Lrp/AsnC family leucine-responsive transcriptional regulator|nr:Lrp/AsnC family transcriptional regulator [Burkholderiaceae bacterium]